MVPLKAQVMIFFKKRDWDLYSLRLLSEDIKVPLYSWFKMLRHECFDKSNNAPILLSEVIFIIEFLDQPFPKILVDVAGAVEAAWKYVSSNDALRRVVLPSAGTTSCFNRTGSSHVTR